MRNRIDDSSGTQPIDLAFYYLTASMGLGQALTISSIRSRLGRFNRSQVLATLSAICSQADRAENRELADRLRLANWLFAGPTATQIEGRLRADRHAYPMSAQTVVNLGLHAMDVCGDGAADGSQEDVRHRLALLLLAFADHAESGGRSRDEMAVEITRQVLFHSINDLSTWLELSGRLYLDVMPRMTSDPDYVDVDQVIADAHGMSFERFWALTALNGIAACESDEVKRLPVRIEGWDVTDDEARSWLNAWSLAPADASAAARRDIATGSGWSFETYVDQPLVRTDTVHGPAIAVRPAWLAAQATPHRMFWSVRHQFVAAGGSHGAWSQFFGRAAEQLGRDIIDEHIPPGTAVLTEHDVETWGPGRNCDAVIIDDDVVAIDFVYHQLTKGSAGTGDFIDLADDLRKTATDKLLQIDHTLWKGMTGGHVNPVVIYPLVVVGAPFPINALVRETVEQQLETHTPKVIGVDPRCQRPMIVDLASFLMMMQSVSAHQMRVADVLRSWSESGLADVPLGDWLVSDGPAARDASVSWHRRVFNAVGLRGPSTMS